MYVLSRISLKTKMLVIFSFAASLILCLAFSVTVATQSTCQNLIHCPCGNTDRNVTVCNETEVYDSCTRWSRCKTCQDDLNHCLECPDGLEGSLCTIESNQKKSRQKRQYYYTYPVQGRRSQRPGNNPMHGNYQRSPGQQNSYQMNPAAQNGLSSCSNLDSPKLGSIRCLSIDQQRTCVGRCLPGYKFQNHELDEELTLVCSGGMWTPMDSFPDCKSEGHCDLVVQGAGSFNCTTGMRGTRCDVNCNNRYAGQYYCYPGLRWDPPLPRCVRPKEVIEERQNCRCEYGASCDSNGRCVCPDGRTGLYCETIIPQVKTCPDPGFISNGLRKKTDGLESVYRQKFNAGQSVVFSCSSEEFALQGSSLMTCKKDGTWSNALPKCIKPAVAPEVMCPDPGQVANADRLNSDGSPSLGVQTYRVGQSVVYTCHSGFALQRRSLITCLASGAWSSRTPHCSRVTPPSPVVRTTTTVKPETRLKFCSDPGVDPNGSRQPRSPTNRQGFPQGTRLEYSCNQGYDLSGERSLFCLLSGEWSALRPRCEAQSRNPDTSVDTDLAYCLNPGSISNGEIVYYPNINNRRLGSPEPGGLEEAEYPEGSRLQYSCRSGYSLEGAASLVCERTGFWSDEPPVCRRDSSRLRYCKNPGSILNGKVSHIPSLNERRPRPPASDDDMEKEYPQGSRLQYSCDSGFTLEGTATLTCGSSGRWSAILPKCTRSSATDSDRLRYCKNPGSISNGIVSHLPSLTERRPRPPDDVLEDEYPQGSRLQFTCDSGFIMEGSRTLTCEASGRWSASHPRCTRTVVSSRDMLSCSNPGPLLNGRVKYISPPATSRRTPVDEDLDDYPEGTRLEYSCDDGYLVQGSSTLSCQSTGFWSSDPPTCVGECGRSFMQTSRRILHGTKTVSGEWPWVVSISVQENDNSRLICGGAVVNSQTVITAAHCLIEASTFVLRFGKFSRRIQDDDAEVLVRRSTRIIIHPDFTNSTLESDIGLVIFQPRIRYSVRVQPICLPSAESTAKNLMTGKKGYVSGWGITERDLPADELLAASLPVISNEACLESYRRQNITLPITRNMFCAGYENAQQSACSGDSGSPLVFYDNTAEKYTLEGLVSFGVEGQCGLPGRYTIFTKVFRFLPWILRNM